MLRIKNKKGFTPTPRRYTAGFLRLWFTKRRNAHQNYKHIQLVWGFTLVELVVYIAIVAVIAVVTTNSVLILNRVVASLRLERRLTSSAETSMRRIAREINLATDIYASSTLNASPGVLSLKSVESESDGAPKDVMFYVSSGSLMMRRATSSPVVLTVSGVTVANLVFREIDNAAISKSVKVELTLRASSGVASSTRNYFITKVLRGGY